MKKFWIYVEKFDVIRLLKTWLKKKKMGNNENKKELGRNYN